MKDFNFLPKGYNKNIRKKRSKSWTNKIIVPYVVIVSFMIIIPVCINTKLKHDKTKVQKEVSNENYFKNKNDQYKILQNIYNQREEQVKNLADYGIDPTDVLDDLQKVMPDKMYIEYLNMTKVKKDVFDLRMKCVAKTHEDAATFLEVLRKDLKYHDAKMTSFDEISSRNTVEFTFSCVYEAKK